MKANLILPKSQKLLLYWISLLIRTRNLRTKRTIAIIVWSCPPNKRQPSSKKSCHPGQREGPWCRRLYGRQKRSKIYSGLAKDSKVARVKGTKTSTQRRSHDPQKRIHSTQISVSEGLERPRERQRDKVKSRSEWTFKY